MFLAEEAGVDVAKEGAGEAVREQQVEEHLVLSQALALAGLVTFSNLWW